MPKRPIPRVPPDRKLKKRKSSPPASSGVELERFTKDDLRTWKRLSENLDKYHVQLYYYLEGQRALRYSELREALCSSPSVERRVSRWVRIIEYRYCLQPLSAVGSLVQGGRFNIGNDLNPSKYPIFPALYLAEDYDTAYQEVFGLRPYSGAAIQGHELALRKPGSFVSVNVSGNVLNLFDLRSAKNLKKFVSAMAGFDVPEELRELARSLGIQGPLLARSSGRLKKDLLAHNWRVYPSQYELPANSQIFGRLILDAGFDGILYPSTKGSKNCVALLPNNFADSESYVEIADEAPRGASKIRLDSNTWSEIAELPPA